jgi:serine phosphatase RsbU (regulator of sigma subunit)/ligand-binding sensor domain-containing protein
MLRYIRYIFWIYAGLFLLCALPLDAQTRLDQSMRLGRLGIADGLSQGMVFCIFQDSRGFMWFGTKEGLNRYDGQHFLVYRRIPGDTTSLADNHVYSITEDQRGRLWIGTGGGGLVMFEPDREIFTQIRLTAEGSDTPIRRIDDVELDGKGRLWVSVLNMRLICLDVRFRDPARIIASARFDGPSRGHPSQEVNRLRLDRFGRLMYLTGAGVYFFNESGDAWELRVSWDRYFKGVPNAGRFVCATVTSDSCIWVSNGILLISRVLRFSPDGTTLLSTRQFSIDEEPQYIRDMLEGPDGLLYLTTYDFLIRYDHTRNTYIATRANKELIEAYSGRGNHLYRNRDGIMWISTSGFGVNTFDPLTLSFQAHGGNINYALFGREMKAFDRYIRGHSGGELGLVNDAYPLRTKEGDVWSGTLDHGLLHYDAKLGTVRQFAMNPDDPYGFLMLRLFRPFVDSRGRVWVGNRHGISQLDQQTGEWAHFWFDRDGPDLIEADDHVTSYFEAPDGTLWLGTMMHGLAHFNPVTGAFVFYRYDSGDANSISHDHVLTLEADPYKPRRWIWIGTDGGGLNRFDFNTQQFTRYGKRDGLPNPVVYGILADEAGFLWMSTNEGLARMEARSLRFRNYEMRDGLQGNEFNRMQYYRHGDSLCFGGVDGYNIFSPRAIRNNDVVPPIVLTGVRLFNTPVTPGATDSPISKSMPYTNIIYLSHDQDMISIEYAALDYHAPDRNRYRYRLEGLTNGWIDAGTDRIATFTNLDPGEYIFQVIGSNNHGVWNRVGASVRIIVTSPWWATTWAFFLYAFVIIGTVLTVDRMQRRRLIAREREHSQLLEAKLRAEAAELEARVSRTENERKQKEVQVAFAIQQRALPQQLPDIPGYDLAAINLPADDIGGDFYDCIPLRDGRMAMVVADVTGKGVPASLLVSSLHAALHVHLEHDQEMISLVHRLNTFLYNWTPPNAFITFLLAVLTPETGDLEIVNAGHNPGLLHHNGSVIETLRSQHLPLGCARDAKPYQSEHYQLSPGDGLLLYTDGVTEAMDTHREPFGHENLEKLVTANRPNQAAMLLGNVISEIQVYASGTEQSDDITALYIRRDAR